MQSSSLLERLLECRRDPAAAAGLGTEMAPLEKGLRVALLLARLLWSRGDLPRSSWS